MIEGRVVVLCRSPARRRLSRWRDSSRWRCRTAADATRRMSDLLADAGLAIVLVESGLYDRSMTRSGAGISARPAAGHPLPGPVWAERASAPDAYVVELLRRAIGYQVRLR